MTQAAVRAVFMRGGTSRALVFHRRDLPDDRAAWDPIFLAAMGSPDPNGRQLDGLGGGSSSLSKIAVVGPSSRDDADVDYTFGQVSIGDPVVQYRGNCGNISSAIGPFAIDEGLVAATGASTRVRIHNTNTGKIIEANVPTAHGRAAVEGELALPGVAGTGAAIRLAFLDPGGATTGRLLPTGHAVDRLRVEGLGEIDVSFVDAVNPVAFASAASVGLSGRETPDELAGRPQTIAALESLRIGAVVAMGLADEKTARTSLRNLPHVVIVSPPAAARASDGRALAPGDMDATARVLSSGQPHRAIPVSAALALAVAMRVPGTIPHRVSPAAASGSDSRIAQPAGITVVSATVSIDHGVPVAREAVLYRTARRLMEGAVLVPQRAIVERTFVAS